jgi:restriction system protein
MWEHREASRLVTLDAVFSDDCIYCRTPLLRLPSASFTKEEKRLFVQLSTCTHCGWWSVYRVHQNEYPRTAGLAEGYSGAVGCLMQLDLTDISLPIDEVRKYLCAKGDSIFDVHPKKLEEIVCSIFNDVGCKARATAYAGDRGIDVILDGCDGLTIGVQVKRYKKERRIEAEQIRSLAGALMQGGHTKGIFVATSNYRSGAKRAAEDFTAIGLPIELINAEAFLKMLGIAQQNSFEFKQDKITSYVLSKGAHVGTGVHKDFVPGEDLRDRPVVIQAFTSSELIELESDLSSPD